MKFLLTLFVMFALCLMGVANAMHVDINMDHALHKALNQDLDQQILGKGDPASTVIDKAFCEMVCHTGTVVNTVAPFHPDLGIAGRNNVISLLREIAISNSPSTPDQPPKRS